jgi:hypothetical protein
MPDIENKGDMFFEVEPYRRLLSPTAARALSFSSPAVRASGHV